MGVFDFFVSEQEKSYRRGYLLDWFAGIFESFFKEYQEEFQKFMNGHPYFISYNKSFREGVTVAIAGEEIPTDIRHCKYISLNKLPEYKNLQAEYQKIKDNDISFEKKFDLLADAITPLLFEAVKLYEKVYSLPSRE